MNTIINSRLNAVAYRPKVTSTSTVTHKAFEDKAIVVVSIVSAPAPLMTHRDADQSRALASPYEIIYASVVLLQNMSIILKSSFDSVIYVGNKKLIA